MTEAAGSNTGGSSFDGLRSLQGHGHAQCLGGEHHGRVQTAGDFDAAAAAAATAVDEASPRRGTVHRNREACGGVGFQGGDLSMAHWHGCGNLDLAVGNLRNGLQSGGGSRHLGLPVRELRNGFPRSLRRGSCRRRRLRDGGVRVGDAELGRVLELAGSSHDDLQAVARHIRLQGGRGGP